MNWEKSRELWIKIYQRLKMSQNRWEIMQTPQRQTLISAFSPNLVPLSLVEPKKFYPAIRKPPPTMSTPSTLLDQCLWTRHRRHRKRRRFHSLRRPCRSAPPLLSNLEAMNYYPTPHGRAMQAMKWFYLRLLQAQSPNSPRNSWLLRPPPLLLPSEALQPVRLLAATSP